MKWVGPMDKRCMTMRPGLDWEKPNSRSDVFRSCDFCVCDRECSGWRSEGLCCVGIPGCVVIRVVTLGGKLRWQRNIWSGISISKD
ncbi:hypothetical protein DY000_02060426 [Brassica cretica]|uniref:Uncharacterized protein n=1 Tax=Brassica cretica TaxID=69181 RepID=A0ABQ7B231_BRACR|nr:hypothetical protein DY000_02060426 [Brassica cretica]